jgi:WXG100 family type VII secretion target
MMADLGVTPAELDSVSAELHTLADGMRSGLSGLDEQVAGLLGSGWSGSAASAYHGVWSEWHEGANQVVQGLTAMSSLLTEAAGRYSGADQSAAGDIAGGGL